MLRGRDYPDRSCSGSGGALRPGDMRARLVGPAGRDGDGRVLDGELRLESSPWAVHCRAGRTRSGVVWSVGFVHRSAALLEVNHSLRLV
jgi:hypothetical protein